MSREFVLKKETERRGTDIDNEKRTGIERL